MTKRTGNHYGRPLAVTVKNGVLRIEIGVDTLAHAVRHSDWSHRFDESRQEYVRSFAITDPTQFAGDVVHALLDEREDGSTPLSDFLDKMTEAAVDDGSEGCEYDQRITYDSATERESAGEHR